MGAGRPWSGVQLPGTQAPAASQNKHTASVGVGVDQLHLCLCKAHQHIGEQFQENVLQIKVALNPL